ncbi:MAG TPA: MFS transporter [Candidatus Acidoferrales bacterium]|nr:MFS transporter [Candidatus Acidoferrales bacterium]
MKTESPLTLSQSQIGRGFSWLVAGLLLLCLLLNYVDRQILAVLAPFLPHSLRMSTVVYGRIQSLFLLSYALAMPVAGWAVDRLGAKAGLAFSVAAWSVIEALHGTARNLLTLGSYRFLLGIPEAAGLPAMTKVASEHAAPHARATLIGAAMFGLGLGVTVAPPIVAFLTLHLGWSWAFYATGVAGLIWVALWLRCYRSTPNPAAATPNLAATRSWSDLLRNRQVIGLTLARAFSDSLWWFYLFWVPPYLAQVRGFNLRQMGIVGWIPYLFTSLGSILGGYASGYLVRQGWEPLRARRTIMWVCACVLPFTSLAVRVSSVWAVLTLLAIATFFMQGYFANLFSLPADLFPREKVASVFGLNSMAGTLCALVMIQATGYVVGRFSYVPVFAAIAFCLPLGAICTQVLVRQKRESSTLPGAERAS